MRQLEFKTSRVRRGWIDRLKGYDRLYETKVTDGERAAYGRGPSREASEQAAIGMPGFTTSTTTIARWNEHLVPLFLSGINITLKKDSGVVPVIPVIREGVLLGLGVLVEPQLGLNPCMAPRDQSPLGASLLARGFCIAR
jgi:hypothetical protein